ncbi:MAG: L-threonylcarbamoyladenylate synthase [Patescibacteria group bacterium]
MNILKLTSENKDKIIKKVVGCLRNKQIVILPFDTVYGFACDATASEAVLEIFKLKIRPLNQTIGVAVSDFKNFQQISRDLDLDNENFISEKIPGKYTFIVKNNPNNNIAAECIKNETIGIRVPKSDFVLKIIRDFGGVIAQTSANKSGMANCYSIEEIMTQYDSMFLDDVVIVDGGKIENNSPSQIFDLTNDNPKKIR